MHLFFIDRLIPKTWMMTACLSWGTSTWIPSTRSKVRVQRSLNVTFQCCLLFSLTSLEFCVFLLLEGWICFVVYCCVSKRTLFTITSSPNEIVSKLENFIFRWRHEAHYGHQHACGWDGPTGNAEGATHDPGTAQEDLHGQCTQSFAQRNHRVSSGIQDFSLRGRNMGPINWEKYLSLKLDSKYLSFYLTKYLMICRYKECVYLKTELNFW